MANPFREVDVENYPKNIRILGIVGLGGLIIAAAAGIAIAAQNAMVTRQILLELPAPVRDAIETVSEAVEG